MTVLGGARHIGAGTPHAAPRAAPQAQPRPGQRAHPRAAARPLATPRRRVSSRARASHRSQPVGALIAFVLVALLVGLIYVAQTIHLAATNYQIDALVAARDDLARQVQTLETTVLRWGTEATVIERAQRLGLDQLETRVRLPAR